jgi:hypothetical protein
MPSARLIGDRSGPCLFRVGQQRLGTFGSLPVCGGSSPVQRCSLLVHVHVANPFRGRPLVHAGGSLVRPGRMAERLHRGGQHLYGGSVRLGRMVPGRFHPLPAGPASSAARVSVPEFLKPRANRVKAGVDLLPPFQGHGQELLRRNCPAPDIDKEETPAVPGICQMASLPIKS